MVTTKVMDLRLWPGITNVTINYEQRRIETTTFGDAERTFIPGMVNIHVELDFAGAKDFERLFALLQAPPPPTPTDPDPPQQLAKRPVRRIDVEGY